MRLQNTGWPCLKFGQGKILLGRNFLTRRYNKPGRLTYVSPKICEWILTNSLFFKAVQEREVKEDKHLGEQRLELVHDLQEFQMWVKSVPPSPKPILIAPQEDEICWNAAGCCWKGATSNIEVYPIIITGPRWIVGWVNFARGCLSHLTSASFRSFVQLFFRYDSIS